MSEVVLSKQDLQGMVGQMMGNKTSNGALIPQQRQQMMRVDANDLMNVMMQLSQVIANGQTTMEHCMKHLHETGQGVDVVEEFEIYLEDI